MSAPMRLLLGACGVWVLSVLATQERLPRAGEHDLMAEPALALAGLLVWPVALVAPGAIWVAPVLGLVALGWLVWVNAGPPIGQSLGPLTGPAPGPVAARIPVRPLAPPALPAPAQTDATLAESLRRARGA